MQLVLSGILNCAQLIGVITSLYTMDKLGRCPLLLFGSVSMTICHIIIAVLVGLHIGSWTGFEDQATVAVVFLFIYMLCFGASWGKWYLFQGTSGVMSILKVIQCVLASIFVQLLWGWLTTCRPGAMGYAVRDLSKLN